MRGCGVLDEVRPACRRALLGGWEAGSRLKSDEMAPRWLLVRGGSVEMSSKLVQRVAPQYSTSPEHELRLESVESDDSYYMPAVQQ